MFNTKKIKELEFKVAELENAIRNIHDNFQRLYKLLGVTKHLHGGLMSICSTTPTYPYYELKTKAPGTITRISISKIRGVEEYKLTTIEPNKENETKNPRKTTRKKA